MKKKARHFKRLDRFQVFLGCLQFNFCNAYTSIANWVTPCSSSAERPDIKQHSFIIVILPVTITNSFLFRKTLCRENNKKEEVTYQNLYVEHFRTYLEDNEFEEYENIKVDLELICRMIVGAQYDGSRAANIAIEVLNSSHMGVSHNII